MKVVILIFLLHVCSLLFSQNNTDSSAVTFTKTPYNPKGNYRNWGLKGKILPVFLGNGGGFSFQLGSEYGFTKNQSFGVDAMYFYFNDHREKPVDTAGIIRAGGDKSYSNQKALFLYYRYYLNLEKWRIKRHRVIYASTYYRLGNRKETRDPAFKNDFISQKEKNNSLGLVVGGIDKFGSEKRLGLDYQIGGYYRLSNSTTFYRENNIEKVNQSKTNNFGFRLGVQLHYWFFIYKH
jgi:hypothetical protein